jgi:hypothetical protein
MSIEESGVHKVLNIMRRREIPACAKHQRLLESGFQQVIGFLDDAVWLDLLGSIRVD